MKTDEKLKRWQPCQGYCQMTGAASAFLSVAGSKVVMNCPRWCAVLAERELANAVKEYEQRLFCSEVLEPDLLYGVSEKLKQAIAEACAAPQNSLLAVLTSCSLSLIGDDIKGVCKNLQPGCQIIAVDAGGLSGEYWNGWSRAVIELLECSSLQPAAPEPSSVNLIGSSTCYPNWEGDMLELKRMLKSVGVKVNLCLLDNGTAWEDLKKTGKAELNVVINEELGLPVAEWLREKLQQKYIITDTPYGFSQSIEWLRKITAALDLDCNADYLLTEIKIFQDSIFDTFAALRDYDNNWQLKRMVISAGSSCARSLAQAAAHDLPLSEQCFVRINNSCKNAGEGNYYKWQYADDLPQLGIDEYQIFCGTDRERIEIGDIEKTIYFNLAMPAARLHINRETCAGINGWACFMQSIFSQLKQFIYLKMTGKNFYKN